jgi:hypothetical protein
MVVAVVTLPNPRDTKGTLSFSFVLIFAKAEVRYAIIG